MSRHFKKITPRVYHGANFTLWSYGSGSRGNANIIEVEGKRILLDAGISPERMQASDVQSIDFVLITHEHQDHAKYVKQYLDRAIDVYMTEGTRQALGLKHHRLHIVRDAMMIAVDNIFIAIYRAIHDAAEPVMFGIIAPTVRVLYATDTGKIILPPLDWTHVIIETNYDVDMLNKNFEAGLIEASVYKRIRQNHLSIYQAVKYLGDVAYIADSLQQVYLAHLSEKNADPKRFKELAQEATGVEVYVLQGGQHGKIS